LWLFADGLLLIKTDLKETKAHGYGPTVSSPPQTRSFSDEQIAEAVKAHKLNDWLSADEITSASFHIGITTGRVNLRVGDFRHKLLWLKRDKADSPLREAFATWDIVVSG
jgi:hypothetical protein